MPDNEQDILNDPFGPEQAPGVSLIVLLRIYDVLVTQLTATHPEAAKELLAAHAAGTLLGPAPRLTGRFVYDEMDDSDK